MLAVIIINVMLALLVLGAIVGSHLWAILSAREAQPDAQRAAMSPLRARRRRRRPQAAPMPRSAAAAR